MLHNGLSAGNKNPPPIPISVYGPVFYDIVLFHWLVSSIKWSGYYASTCISTQQLEVWSMPPPQVHFWNLEIMRLLLLEPFLVKTMHVFGGQTTDFYMHEYLLFSAHCAIQHSSFGFPIVR